MEPEGSSPHSQAPATCPYPEPAQSSPHTHIPLLYCLLDPHVLPKFTVYRHLISNCCKWPTWRKFFSICLFQFSTRFEQLRVHHQENQLYQYNIWYVSLCVGDRLVCRSGSSSRPAHETVSSVQVGKFSPTCTPDGHLHRVTRTRCIDTIDSPDDEHEVARNMQRIEINI
jgi:hypothetical protein